jgi:putative holliday junction resolvase
MRFLGIDHGQSKIGLALGDNEANFSLPYKIIKTEDFFNVINNILEEENIDEIVLGLPKNLDNEDTQQTAVVYDFLNKLKEQVKLPIHLEDERMTSIMGKGMQGKYLREDSRKENRKDKLKIYSDEDASSAALILETYLKKNYGI